MRSPSERTVFVRWLLALAATTLVSCSSVRGDAGSMHRPPPGVVPALSIAGSAASGCMEPRNPRRSGHGFEIADPVVLEVVPERIRRAGEIGGVGHAIVHYFGCPRFAIELTVLLDGDSGELRRADALLAASLFEGATRGALWDLADRLRLSPSEPFVYGAKLSLSDNESFSLRFDPSRSDARLMMVYRIGL